MRAKWLKKDTNHHKYNHSYEFYVKAPSGVRGDYCYLVHTTYDYTSEEEVDFNDHFSSEISLKQSFKIDKLELDNDQIMQYNAYIIKCELSSWCSTKAAAEVEIVVRVHLRKQGAETVRFRSSHFIKKTLDND